MPQTIQEAVGAFLARFRSDNRLSQEAIALSAVPFGVSWGPSKIRRIEDADAQLSIGDVIVLVEAMRRAARRTVTLKDVFPDDLTMVIGEVPITGAELRGVLRGETNAWMEPRRIGFGVSHLLDRGPAVASLATRRAARRLGITPEKLDEISFERWMQTFDEMVVSYTDGDSQQAKGHATRRVLLELEGIAAVADISKQRAKRANVTPDGEDIPTEEEARELGAVANETIEEAPTDDQSRE